MKNIPIPSSRFQVYFIFFFLFFFLDTLFKKKFDLIFSEHTLVGCLRNQLMSCVATVKEFFNLAKRNPQTEKTPKKQCLSPPGGGSRLGLRGGHHIFVSRVDSHHFLTQHNGFSTLGSPRPPKTPKNSVCPPLGGVRHGSESQSRVFRGSGTITWPNLVDLTRSVVFRRCSVTRGD